jgi:hypothetical protein
MSDKGGYSMPERLLAFVRPKAKLAALQPPTEQEYEKLRTALKNIANLQAIPVKSSFSKHQQGRERIRLFMGQAGFPRPLTGRLLRVYEDHREKRRTLLKNYESKMLLDFFERTGLTMYEAPILAFAGQEDMLFHAFAAKSGNPNSDVILKQDIDETYEVYTVDIGPVLADQGRYNLFRGCLRIKKKAGERITHTSFYQPSVGAPGDRQKEKYSGYLFLQDDTAYVMSFKDQNKDERAEGLIDIKQETGRQAGMRHNLAMMVLNGLSRGPDGLYEKFVGGQLGRALTGTSGIFASPCVLYRVTGDRLRYIEDLHEHKYLDSLETSRGDNYSPANRKYERVFQDGYEAVNAVKKFEFMRASIGMEDIIFGIERDYASVMSDLNIPIPRQDGSEERHMDFNFFGQQN